MNLWRGRDYFFDKEALAESQNETERRRRLREPKEGLDSQYPNARDDQTGLHNQSEDGCCRSARKRGQLALRGTRQPRSVWQIPTQAFRGAHFATFPEEIPHRAIAAGTSEYGCCWACGAPWERVVRTPNFEEQPQRKTAKALRTDRTSAGQAWQDWRNENANVTMGWQPTCSCFLTPDTRHLTPAIVLDPFSGSGTVGQVAFKMGRRFVCLELKEQYLELAKERIPPMAFQV